MPDDIYVINLIAKDGQTIQVQDSGLGPDWLILLGGYVAPSDIRLSWTSDNGATLTSSGLYYIENDTGALVGSRVIVNAPVENVRGSLSEDFIQGNELDNILYGDAAADGPGANDTIWGFDGNDWIYGGKGRDIITGDDGSDFLFGNAGSDTISGGAGVDIIEGGGGADLLSGGGDRLDRVAYYDSPEGVKIRLTYGEASIGIGGDAAGDTITGFGYVIGSDHDDVIIDTVAGTIAFGYNANVFEGAGGNDRLILGGGNDTGYGGSGDDHIEGGEGRDKLFGNDGNDFLDGGAAQDKLTGGAGTDFIKGGDGGDELDGGVGNDTLIGGAGADTLTGGAGADNFSLRDPTDSGSSVRARDTIIDFESKTDTIDLVAIDADLTTAHNDAFVFMGKLPFSGAAGELRLVDTTDGILVLLNLDDDLAPEMSFLLADIFLVREADFAL
ncbi:MAG: calcium-binding protein, partial [bacterium]